MNSLNQKYPIIGMVLVALLPLYNIQIASFSVVIFSVLSLVYLFTKFKLRWNPDYKSFFITSIPFSLYFIGVFYSRNTEEGIKVMEYGFALFAFPFVYFIILGKHYSITQKELNVILRTFVYASTIMVIYTVKYLGDQGVLQDLFNNEMLQNATQNKGVNTIRHAIEYMPFIGEHPSYFALISLVSGGISIYEISQRKAYIFIVTFFISILGVFISGAKMGGVIFVIITLLFIFYSIKLNRKTMVGGAIGVFLFAVLVAQIPYVKARFLQISTTKFEPPQGINYNSTNVRVGVYNCVFETIKKSPLIGFGTGGSKNEMISCYRKYDTDIFERAGFYYNSHNQYLSFVLSNGAYGLILFFYWMGSFLYLFVKRKEHLFVVVWVIFGLMFMTENILERQTGVILFSLLMPLFFKFSLQKEVEL